MQIMKKVILEIGQNMLQPDRQSGQSILYTRQYELTGPKCAFFDKLFVALLSVVARSSRYDTASKTVANDQGAVRDPV